MVSKVFIDTSFFKALLDDKDDFHIKAKKIWRPDLLQSADLITSNYILDETFTLIRVRAGRVMVMRLRDFFIQHSPTISIQRVTIDDEANAWKWFTKNWSKLSFTDCVSFALMKRLGIEKSLSFDAHYRKAGFDLVE